MGDNNQDLKESVASENRESVKSGDQKFDFITETIKKKPINKKRVFGKTRQSQDAGCGGVRGGNRGCSAREGGRR